MSAEYIAQKIRWYNEQIAKAEKASKAKTAQPAQIDWKARLAEFVAIKPSG